MRQSNGLRAALAGAAVQNQDPDFENTVLLLHGDGTNGAQNNTFIDGSTNNFTITRNGNTTQGAFSPFGDRWSNYFDGNGDRFSLPLSQTPLALGSSDFTLEAWVYKNNTSTACLINGQSDLATEAGSSYIFYVGTVNSDLYVGSSRFAATSPNPSVGVWSHVAYVRTGGTFSTYLNGTRVGTNSSVGTSSVNIGSTSFPSTIGDKANGLNPLNGYISNLRLIKGSGGYDAASSTITVSTAPLTAVTNTSLLICKSNRFTDHSVNNLALTPIGDVRVEKFNPFGRSAPYSSNTDGGSGFFDGNGDCLSFAANSAFAFGTGDFTVEYWFYRNSADTFRTVFDFRVNGSSSGLSDYIDNNNKFSLYGLATDLYTSTASVLPYQWVHIAVCRSGSTVRVFINGNLDGSFTLSSNLSDNNLLIGTNVAVGGGIGGAFFNGYVSNFRALKGTALYNSSFTPPTAPLSAITNTSLLLNFANAGIIDNTGLNVLETVGNAQIDTGIKKFGTGSLEFDGSGDSLSVSSNPFLDPGSGDFTIECWAYSLTALSSYIAQYAHIAGKGNGVGSGTYAIAFYLSTFTFVSGGTIVQGSSSLTNNTWYHLAVTRSGSTIRLFVNGVVDATVTNSSQIVSGSSFNVGDRQPGDISGQCPLNGYVDDLRITKGVARYTANFTPPTAPFPNF